MILIDYAHLLPRTADPSEAVGSAATTFHTRQLFLPVQMTVHSTLSSHSLSILSLPSTRSNPSSPLDSPAADVSGDHTKIIDLSKALIITSDGEGAGGDHFLFAFDVTNTYGSPFNLTTSLIPLPSTSSSSSPTLQQTHHIPPGTTTRILLPFPQFRLPATSSSSKQIPSFMERQYIYDVATKGEEGKERERNERELFWYKEAILERIRCVWDEPLTARSGVLQLRGMRLKTDHLRMIRSPLLKIQISIITSSPVSESQDLDGGGHPIVGVESFSILKLQVTNLSDRSIPLLARLSVSPAPSSSSTQAQALHPTHILIDGPLSGPLGHVGAGESAEWSVGVWWAVGGLWEVGGGCEGITSRRKTGEQGSGDLESGLDWVAARAIRVRSVIG